MIDLGHRPIPHLASRLVDDRAHVARIARWCRNHGLTAALLVAGDPPEPVGPYGAVAPFLRDLLDTDHGLRRIGVAAYPDGHSLIDRPTLREALHAKQDLLAQAGITGWATTQMCFDAEQWRSWAHSERSAGLSLPLHLGLPGVVDRTKLLTMGVRLGIGASLGTDQAPVRVTFRDVGASRNVTRTRSSGANGRRRPPSATASLPATTVGTRWRCGRVVTTESSCGATSTRSAPIRCSLLRRKSSSAPS